MIDGLLLQTVEGLEDEPAARASEEVWKRLQDEKQVLTLDLLSEDPLCQSPVGGLQETDASEESPRVIEWHHRGQLEARLRELSDAQNRLIKGLYGRCADCGNAIGSQRLQAVPEATLCITCQRITEPEVAVCTL